MAVMSQDNVVANTAEFTNMITARFRNSRYLVKESKVFIKDKTNLYFTSSRVLYCTPQNGVKVEAGSLARTTLQ